MIFAMVRERRVRKERREMTGIDLESIMVAAAETYGKSMVKV